MILLDVAEKILIRIRTWIPFLFLHQNSLPYAWRWVRSVSGQRTALDDAVPWFHFYANDWLEKYVKSSMKVFEWGSGGSTIFWACHAGQVIAVEHDRCWYERVLSILESKGLTNVTMTYSPCSQNDRELRHIREVTGLQFNEDCQEYTERINYFSDEEFDIVVVDGKAREICLKNAIPKIKQGGVLVFDNSDRYPESLKVFSEDEWSLIHFQGPTPYERTGSFTTTTLIIRK